MKKFFTSLLLLLLVFIIYFLFVPVKMIRTNNYLVDKYFIISSENINQKSSDNQTGYFSSSNECGYFSYKDGISYYKKISANADNKDDEESYILANSLFFLIFSKTGDKIDIYNTKGEKTAEVNTYGYPYISSELPVFYVLKTNGMGFSLYSAKGEKLIKEINFTSMITSISTDKFISSLVSTVDGKTFLYSSKGENLDEKSSADARISIAKSNYLDHEGRFMAVCSGIDPEYIELYDKAGSVQLMKFKTDTNFRYRTFLKINNDTVYFEGKDEIKYYDYKNRKKGALDFTGQINEIAFSKNGDILISSISNNIYYLNIYAKNGIKKFYREFSEPADNFNFIDVRSFYFRLSDNIIIMTLEK
jgi:hypothetical protein